MTTMPLLPQDPIVAEVETLSKKLRLPERYRALDLKPAFPWKEFKGMGRARMLGLRTPESLGGRGLALPSAGIGLFHLAYHGGTTFAKLSLQPEFSSVVAEQGSPALVDRYFRKMMHGEMLIGNHVTEPAAGSDIAGIESTAEATPEGYVVRGSKSEVAFVEDAQASIVYARVKRGSKVEEGISAFLVPQDLPGISRSVVPDLGERWMRRGTVRYDAVLVATENRIGEEGRALDYLKRELERERALLACIYLGVARSSWEETVRYVGERAAFGKPLRAQQAVSFPLVEDWARLDAAWGYTQRTLERLESGMDAGAHAALAKWMSTETALTAIDHAIQFHGGRGYSQEFPHEQRWRDVRSGAIAHGPSEIMHLVAARALWK